MKKNTSPVQIWHKIIDKFNKEKIDYVLVEGVALVIHGLPRSTLDIDIYVPAKEDVLIKLFQLTYSLGLKSKQKDIFSIQHRPELFANQWICFSYKGQDILDVFFSEEHEFKKLYKNSKLKKDKTMSVRVASLDDIAAMKKASGRSIDLADINFIKEVKRYRRT